MGGWRGKLGRDDSMRIPARLLGRGENHVRGSACALCNAPWILSDGVQALMSCCDARPGILGREYGGPAAKLGVNVERCGQREDGYHRLF